jgi:uncharacterized membrane protein YqaE (UPF0057 family)
MNKNWILLLFAIIGLASCSVEKRVYQPGYHVEWNHGASRDVAQDASQDVSQDASQDVSQDASQDASQDVSQDASQDVSQDASQDVSQDASQAVSRKEKMGQLIQTVAPVRINSAKAENQLGQNIDSDLELVLLIILALFLPALTIFLVEGLSKNFWIALLLMAVAYLLPISSFVVRGLIVAIATILAIAVVFHYV